MRQPITSGEDRTEVDPWAFVSRIKYGNRQALRELDKLAKKFPDDQDLKAALMQVGMYLET